jgi:serine phosphatase RsbU (regulator of sigma subunit)
MQVKPNLETSKPTSSAVVATETPIERNCWRVALVCALLTVVLGLLTIVAWTTGWHILASGRSKYIPMAPSTALGFLLLGTALFLQANPSTKRAGRPLLMANVSLALAFPLLKLLEFFTGIQLRIEEWLVRDPAMFGSVPTARMSPVTASTFLLAGSAMAALVVASLRRWAGFLAAATVIIALLIILGYLYGTPLLYGGKIIPVALLTALAFLCIGIGLVAAAGTESWPLRPLIGSSTRTLLLRAFLPVTIVGVLINGAIWRIVALRFDVNPALLSASSALIFALAMSAVILQVANIVGGRIDRAEAERNLAQQELRALNQQLEQRVSERTRQLRERNAEMEEELKMARELQLAMLPQQFPNVPRSAQPNDSALQFLSFYYPTGAVSGDFFDVVPLSDTAVGIFICDVMGHGVRAALVTAMMRALVEELSAKAADPGTLLTQINRDLAKILQQTGTVMYVTACYVVLDVARSHLLYANAGHPNPLHVQPGAGSVHAMSANEQSAPAMGLFDDIVYRTSASTIHAGDLLLLFTDGVFEVDSPAGEQFSHELLLAAVQRRAHLAPHQLLSELLSEIRQFSANQSFADDVCVIAVEVTRLC